MKTLISGFITLLIVATLAVLLSSCGTAHKIENSLKTSLDSLSKQKRDSSSFVKTDSVGKTLDQSLVTTTEHIVSTTQTIGFDTTVSLALVPRDTIYHLLSPDRKSHINLKSTSGSFILDWGQIPSDNIQSIDRTTTEHKNINSSSSVATTNNTKTNSKNDTHTVSAKATSSLDKTVSGLGSLPWWVWAIVVVGVFILILIVANKVRQKLSI
jgi:hypothetical protein